MRLYSAPRKWRAQQTRKTASTIPSSLMHFTLLLSVFSLHIVSAPFSKVEESFNLHAVYDLLYKPLVDLREFDHIHFPGVVSRTFVAPLIVAAVAAVPKAVLPPLAPRAVLLIVRHVVAAANAFALAAVARALEVAFEPRVALAFVALVAVQFHVPFYAGRTLPNCFALVLTNLAFADMVAARTPSRAVALLATALALLRSELCLLLFPTLVVLAMQRRLPFVRGTALAVAVATASACASVAVDSHFWRRLAYPELEVFFFNAVRGQSAAWGVSPPHWYFSSALPRMLGGALPLAAVGMGLSRRMAVLVAPSLFFVAVYSALPHKEARFVFYAVPPLTAAAAVAAVAVAVRIAWAVRAARKRLAEGGVTWWKGLRLGVAAGLLLVALCACFAASVALTAVMTVASAHNYPAGYALQKMHAVEGRRFAQAGEPCAQGEARVHVDVHAAMNGVSQFGYVLPETGSCPRWSYDKCEGDMSTEEMATFTHLVTERRTVDGFCEILAERRFERVALVPWGRIWRPSLVTKEDTFVLRNVNVSRDGCR